VSKARALEAVGVVSNVVAQRWRALVPFCVLENVTLIWCSRPTPHISVNLLDGGDVDTNCINACGPGRGIAAASRPVHPRGFSVGVKSPGRGLC